jgi:probable O-glycosylation ligase (exosortase A-associated)
MNSNRGGIILGFALCGLMTAVWYFAPHPIIPLAIALLPLAFLFVLNQTFWFVILFVIFSFFRIHEAIPVLFSLKIPLLLSLGALSALMWHLLISRKLAVQWHHSLTWLAIFWVLVILGMIFASNRGVAIAYFKNIYWKIMLMTLAIVWLVNNVEQLKQTILLIVSAGMIVGYIAMSNSIQGIGLVEGTRVTIGREIGSMLGDPNDLALVLMFPLAFSLSLLLTGGIPKWQRLIGIISTVILMAAVIATQSRGGLLGSLTTIGIFAWRLIRNKTLLISVGSIAALLLYTVAGVSDRASGGAAEEGVDASAMGRLYAWEAAFRMAVEHPFFGVGIDNFYSNYFFYSPHWDGLNHAVHSTWFGVLAETGFLGFVIFITTIISLIRTAKNTLNTLSSDALPHHRAAAIAVFAALVGTIVSGTFLTQGFNWPIYILAALTVAIARISQNDSQNKNATIDVDNK